MSISKNSTELSLVLNYKFNIVEEHDGYRFYSLFRGLIFRPQNSFSFVETTSLNYNRILLENIAIPFLFCPVLLFCGVDWHVL